MGTNANIICPFCHKEFPLTESITNQIENQLKSDYDIKIAALKESQKEEQTQLEKNC
jgi:RNA-binding protein YhbY